jgi:hypothetical protein
MEAKLKELIDEEQNLNEIGYPVQSQILDDIMHNMRQPQGMRFKKSFEKRFLSFMDTFHPLYLSEIERDWHEEMDNAFDIPLPAWGFLGYIVGGHDLDKRSKDNALAVTQNALVYAIACSYQTVIPKMYMRAKQEVPGTHIASYPDRVYAAYVTEFHPLLAAFVRSKHKLFDDKILAIIGYLLNSKLEKA